MNRSDAQVLDALSTATRPDQAALDRLHARLAELASIEGLLDASYSYMDSPIGRLMLVATDVGLVKIAFEHEHFDDVLIDLGTRIGPRILHARERLDEVERELAEYFEGRRTHFDLVLDLSLTHGFRQRATSRWPRWSAIPARPEPSAAHAQPIRFPSCCPVIECSGRTARLADTQGALMPSAPSSRWSAPHEQSSAHTHRDGGMRGRSAPTHLGSH